MITQIGITAGAIWDFLDKNGTVELPRLVSDLEHPQDLILMSLGWLIKEGHVVLKRHKTDRTISLRKRAASKARCPDFKVGAQNLCLGCKKGLMLPSSYEMENFCLTDKYERCPLRFQRRKDKA